jgi:exodeoxyribonuclease V gamma subunit
LLHVHRAERADALVAALGELLVAAPSDPFAPELIAVPTRGIERWLTQRMAHGLGATNGHADGICANVEFPTPHRLVTEAVATASGIDPDSDPWLPERSVWPLLQVVEGAITEPWLAVLAAHLGADDDEADEVDQASRRARRFATVRHLADLFDRYAIHRPEMLRGWIAGDDSVPDSQAWQPELWRRLRDRLDAPSPAERTASACDRLRGDATTVDLPERLSLFGLTRLPATYLEVLRALAVQRDVHVFALHPSPALWDKVAAIGAKPTLRRDDPTAWLPDNRLMASWGRDARELQLVLAADDDAADHHHPIDDGARVTLLARIQQDVAQDTAPPGPPLPDALDERPPLDPDDRSVQVHSCHGRARQVEVLRDAILHELSDDPTLEPRDVIVMCPDIETFAPLIKATFGAGEVSDEDDDDDGVPEEVRPPDLRVRLADRALRQTNPVLGVVARLLELASERVTASQLLDLADREPVRRRFHLDDDDLARIGEWVADSGIRWGLDADHRAPFKLSSVPDGTWSAGLDRVLVGVTMAEDDERLFGGVLPLDDVDSGAIDLAGRLAEFVDRTREAIEKLAGPQPIAQWAATIGEAADALAAVSERHSWQRSELGRLLDDVVSESAGDGTELTLGEVRALLDDRLAGRPTRANFRTGHLTICTLMPMRSVPHRVVCLLGLDDGVFPRKAARDGDDLTVADPHVGDRDARSEDRQLLLDALLAATDRLIVTYTGNDERTNVPLPPAVPVGELLDVIDRTVHIEGEDPARTRVLVRHPLQPFDPRNFARDTLQRPAAWSFDPVMLDGAQALEGNRQPLARFLTAPLPREETAVVELDDLVRFVEHPVKAFLRQRLGLSVGDWFDDVDDAMPIELDNLEKWHVGHRLLDARLGGADIKAAIAAEVARGSLPPGALANQVLQDVGPTVEAVARAAQEAMSDSGATASVDVKLPLPDGRLLSGTVPGVAGDVLCTVNFSRLAAKQRLATWVRFLALAAARPDLAYEAFTIGRAAFSGPREATVSIARIGTLGLDPPGRARAALEQLGIVIDLYDRGMREPLPIACAASAAYAHADKAGGDPIAAARGEWESGWNFPREDAQPEHQLVLGGVVSLEDLLADQARDDETGVGWDTDQATRFGRYACRLWAGLLEAEKVEHR